MASVGENAAQTNGGAITAAKFPKLSRTNPPPLRCTPPSAISALIHQENTKGRSSKITVNAAGEVVQGRHDDE